jgi:hypothetical protein
MSVRLDGNIILLEGDCRVEDAEPLLALLRADSARVVDLSSSEQLHTAIVQILMALRPRTKGSCKDCFVQEWIAPFLQQAAI